MNATSQILIHTHNVTGPTYTVTPGLSSKRITSSEADCTDIRGPPGSGDVAGLGVGRYRVKERMLVD